MNSRKDNQPAQLIAGQNNSVVAVYAAHPKILELDNPNHFEKPFLFYIGSRDFYNSANAITDGSGRKINGEEIKPFIGKRDEFQSLTQGRLDGKLLDSITVNGREIQLPWFGPFGAYVPFSAGIGHEGDVKKEIEARQAGTHIYRTDLPQFREVLRQFDEKQKEENSFVNRVYTFLGFR